MTTQLQTTRTDALYRRDLFEKYMLSMGVDEADLKRSTAGRFVKDPDDATYVFKFVRDEWAKWKETIRELRILRNAPTGVALAEPMDSVLKNDYFQPSKPAPSPDDDEDDEEWENSHLKRPRTPKTGKLSPEDHPQNGGPMHARYLRGSVPSPLKYAPPEEIRKRPEKLDAMLKFEGSNLTFLKVWDFVVEYGPGGNVRYVNTDTQRFYDLWCTARDIKSKPEKTAAEMNAYHLDRL